MANNFKIPRDVEQRLRARESTCAYCRREMKAYPGLKGAPGDKATIEHLNREGPFYWPDLEEKHIVMACNSCNASRGQKRLRDWFETPYCQDRGIGPQTVNKVVQDYLADPISSQ